MGKADQQKLHKNCERAEERWRGEPCICFQYLIPTTGIPTPSTPYDWSIVQGYFKIYVNHLVMDAQSLTNMSSM